MAEDWCKGFTSGVKTATEDRRGYCYQYRHGSTTDHKTAYKGYAKKCDDDESLQTTLYTHSTNGATYDVQACIDFRGKLDGTPDVVECSVSGDHLNKFPVIRDQLIDENNHEHFCRMQYGICESIPEHQTQRSPQCKTHYSGCQSALRHLHAMMFNQSPKMTEPQICNNFARKSVRGFFHDFMSNQIDGSILSEHHIGINFGLCRWAQYVNVLSDHTKCDPGSIIAMAGMLGYEACGVPIWEVDTAVKPYVQIGRGYKCGANTKPYLFDEATGQRKDAFSDTQASSNSTAMEEFWYHTNFHFGRPDGEVEYSAEAGAAAHAIGRVTCQPDGLDTSGKQIKFKKGFFHKARTTGMTERQFYGQALDKMSATQCDLRNGQQTPTGAMRRSTDQWPVVEGETDMNPEGGFCGMPTQFLGTVRVGSRNRVPRWISTTENAAKERVPFSKHQPCKDQMKMYIPWELLTIATVPLPQSPALQRFRDIAWDGFDSIDSAWDSCEVGCAIPVNANSMCGGKGLAHFDWTKQYCDQGALANGGRACCEPSGTAGCTNAAAIKSAGRVCTSYWDVDCMVPKVSDGGVCSADGDCKSDKCTGGRCCNTFGKEKGCSACDVSGNCQSCLASGYLLKGPVCVNKCECTPGCDACDCGTCTKCDATRYFLKDGDCQPRRTAGKECTANHQCFGSDCRGGNCCAGDGVLKAGCTDCNYRGLCEGCSTGYELCDHHQDGQGQCNKTLSGKEGAFTMFKCGTGGKGTDWPSTDDYDYCHMAGHCPGPRAGCYYTAKISQTCWTGTRADFMLNKYKPPEFTAPTQGKGTPFVLSPGICSMLCWMQPTTFAVSSKPRVPPSLDLSLSPSLVLSLSLNLDLNLVCSVNECTRPP